MYDDVQRTVVIFIFAVFDVRTSAAVNSSFFTFIWT